MSGEGTDDRLSQIEERLDRIESLLKALGNGRGEQDPGSDGEPLDVEEAKKRLENLGQRIDEAKSRALSQEDSAEPAAESEDPAPEPDVEQAEETVGEGPPAPG
jgi:tetrahydromethanopterin S-methyltransferase subunit G